MQECNACLHMHNLMLKVVNNFTLLLDRVLFTRFAE